jgi:hypothetical protein
MENEIVIEQLKKEFLKKLSFPRDELYGFFQQFDPDLKAATFRWKIHDLKNKQIITPVSRDFFTLSYKPMFKPNSSERENEIFSKIQKHFPTLKFCIWSTQIVSEFMLHIPAQFITVLQVEKEAIEPVYDFLKVQNFKYLFIQPGEKEIDRYVYESDLSIVLQSLVSKSPIQKVNKLITVTLEKLIVDLYSDKKLFAVFQGNEWIHIVNNAYNRYSIDFTKLFHYAKRRGKEAELTQVLNKTDIPKQLYS